METKSAGQIYIDLNKGLSLAKVYDFNTSNLVTYLLDLVKELNGKLRAKEDFVDTYDTIMLINYILGLEYEFVMLSDSDKEIYNKWSEYRNNKDFENADKMRAELVDRKII